MDDRETSLTDGPRSAVERSRRWLLLDGNRLVVAGGLTVAIAALVVALELLGIVSGERNQPTFYVFSGLISGNLTLITVAVSINQLVLSRELGAPGELKSQMEDVIDYREQVEEAAGEIAPIRPQPFLVLLFETTRQEAQRLGGLAFGPPADAARVREEVDDLVSELTDHIDRIDDLLGGNAGIFNVLSVTLTTNYAEEIHRIRRVRSAHGDELPTPVVESLDRLIDRLQEIDVARQYFKSIYLQNELSVLSRLLFYAGVPAEVAATVMLLLFTTEGGVLAAHSLRFALFPAAVAVGFVPLAVLGAFVVRIATVTQRTAATLPFTTPEQER